MSFPNQVVVQIFEPSTPFGGVQVNLDQQPTVQIALDSGSPVQSVFGRVGDIQPQCSDYASCYAPLGGGLPGGGLTGQTLTKLSDTSLDVGWSNAGAGTVTSFSAGNLSPLFATNVATPSSTPALTFSLSNAPAHSFLGNNTGAPAAPSYVQPAFSDLSGQFALNQTPSTTAGVLIGRGAGSGAGIFQEITLGTNLSMSGTTLNASGGGGGNVSNSGTPTLDQTAVWTDATHIKGVTTLKGGTTNQILAKASNTDYDWGWVSPGGGGNVSTSGVITTGQLAEWVTGTTIRSDTPAQARTAIGATTLGGNLITATNPSAITFIRVNADNSVTLQTAANFRTDISAAGSGAVGSSGLTMNTARLLGRTTAAAGAIEEITVNAEFSFSATALALATAGVAYAKIQNVAALSVFGRASNSAGVGADISAGADFNVLRRSGTSIGFGPIDLSQAGAVTGDLGFANLAQGSARSVLGVTGNATADFASIQGTADQVLVVNGAGTALAFGTVATNGITNAAVTYAKMQNVAAESVLCRANTVAGTVGEVALAASQLLGRGATGDVAAITLGSGLSMTGTTLNVTAGGGNVSNSGTPTANQIAQWTDATHIQGITPTSPLTVGAGSLSLNVGVDHAFTAAQTLTLAPGANTFVPGWTLKNTTAATAGNQQFPPVYQLQGQGFLTGGTPTNQTVEWRIAVETKDQEYPVGSGLVYSRLVFQHRTNGGSWTTLYPFIDNAGNFSTQGGGDAVVQAASVYGLDDVGAGGDGSHPISIVMRQNGVGAPAGNGCGIWMNSLGAVIWGAGTAQFDDGTGSRDTCISRDSAGVVGITNGQTIAQGGAYADIHLRNLIASNTVHLTPTTAPGSPTEGDLYGDSTTHKIYYRNNSAWVDLTLGGGGGGSPGGAVGDVQLNDGAGGFTAGAYLHWATSGATRTLTVGEAAADSFILTPGLGMTIKQTGDTFGETSLLIGNRSGMNGALLTNAGLDLVDICFKPSVGVQNNIRNEHRAGSLADSTLNPNGEFQLFDDATGTGTMHTIFGKGRNVFTQHLTFAVANGVNKPTNLDVGLIRTGVNTLKVTNGSSGFGIITGNGTVPAGGTTNQVLSKNSNSDYDLKWATAGGGGTVDTSGSPLTGNLAQFSGPTTITNVHNPGGSPLFIKLNSGDSFSLEASGTHRTSLGATTAGSNLFTISNPASLESAIALDTSGNVVFHVIGGTGASDVVTPAGTQTLTNKRITQRVVAQASGATWSPNGDTTDVFTITTAQATNVTTINSPSGTPTDGQKLVFRIKCDGTPRTLAGWNAGYRFSSDMTAPTTLIASKTLYMLFIWNATDSVWDNLAQMNNF